MIENRKGFVFYKSYYDVAIELPESERLSFLMAILHYEFTGEELPLEGMAKFAFISQKHSIKAQVNGYMYKATKGGIKGASVGGKAGASVGGKAGASVQEKEKEKEQEKEQEEEKVKGEGPQTKIFGFDSKYFIVVKPKYVNERYCRIQGKEGLRQYLEENQTILSWPEYAEKFMRQYNGKVFNDLGHLQNTYSKFITESAAA